MKPLVTIIIPTYNRAHLIAATLNSIIAQSYSNWECLVIDDDSTDNTQTLIEGYIAKDKRFQYFKRPNNRPKGANACRNYGYELSRGNYINWFDSDDIMMCEKIRLQVEQMEKESDLDYSICQSLFFENDKKQNKRFRGKLHLSDNKFEDYILYKIFWLTTAPLWRKEFIMEYDLKFDESLHQSQEYDFHIKALANSVNYGVLNEPLVEIIRYNDSISNNWKKDTNKVTSNIKVKLNTLRNYSDRLSPKAKLKILEMLTLLFKDLLVYGRYADAKSALLSLKTGIQYSDLSKLNKRLFLFKAWLIYLSYRIFGRGYNLLKPIS